MNRIAIIGAGLSGLTLARALSGVAEVTVFEKARGVGGRMSTRYAHPFYFDHGTQFFTARTAEFQRFLAPLIGQGIVAEWSGKVVTLAEGEKPEKRLWFEPHYVAAPNMNSLCKHLAEGLHVVTNTEIAPLEAGAPGWDLQDTQGKTLGHFDWVISTAPPIQTRRLFAPMPEAVPPVALQGCYALMLGFRQPWEKSWIAAKLRDEALDWLAVNSSKPGRDAAVTCLVVQSRNDWAEAHIDDDMETAQAYLFARFEAITGLSVADAEYRSAHRWRYALNAGEQTGAPMVHAPQRLAACGDWCTASRIEDVWLGAMKTAQMLKAQLAV